LLGCLGVQQGYSPLFRPQEPPFLRSLLSSAACDLKHEIISCRRVGARRKCTINVCLRPKGAGPGGRPPAARATARRRRSICALPPVAAGLGDNTLPAAARRAGGGGAAGRRAGPASASLPRSLGLAAPLHRRDLARATRAAETCTDAPAAPALLRRPQRAGAGALVVHCAVSAPAPSPLSRQRAGACPLPAPQERRRRMSICAGFCGPGRPGRVAAVEQGGKTETAGFRGRGRPGAPACRAVLSPSPVATGGNIDKGWR